MHALCRNLCEGCSPTMLSLEDICAMTSTILRFQSIVYRYEWGGGLSVSIRISRRACRLVQCKDYGVFVVEDALN